MTEQLIQLGNIDESDTLGSGLHFAAINGNKRALKKVLDKGIHIDFPNDEGQSPLFCACLCGHGSVVEYLLSAGADPNEKSNLGLTPVHAASYSGYVKILMKLLAEGGDLRLHDNQGRSVKDWAMLQPTPKKRMKMLEFLDKTRLFAMSSSGQDLLTRKASSKTIHRAHHRRNTVTKIIRDRIGRPSIHNKLEKMATDHHSLGFGQVYSNGTEKSGFISAIPLVGENNLKHDPEGETFNNGAFCVMESMWWDYTEVTIKRLHRELDPYQGGVVDLLINEIQHIGKLRHPNILTLMGVCQTNNLDGLVVIYERITLGSLYNCLHQKMERLPSQAIKKIAIQMCNAIIFIHLQGLVHCAISSHAISVVGPEMYKLGNFEYMLEISKCELGKKNAVATNTSENAVYNWMGPEIMMNLPPSFYCDMYSYCAVIWEIFHGAVPWSGHCSEAIKAQYHKGNRLKLVHGQIPEYYKVFLDYGLQLDPNNRKLSFLHVRDLLQASPKDTKQYMRTHFQHLQQNTSSSVKTPQTTPSAPRREEIKPSNGPNRSKFSDDERKKQRKRYRSNNTEEEKFTSRKGYNENCQPNRKFDDLLKAERRALKHNRKSPWNDACFEDDTYQPNTRDHQFEMNRFTTETQEVDDEAYHYTVQMKKGLRQNQEPDRQVEFSPAREHYKTTPKSALESTTSDEDGNTENMSQTTSTDSQQYARGRTLERKTSSLGNFSYLNIGNHTRTRSAGAKPACHGQCEIVAEEYSTKGKLTTAGSIYALYNDHSPDLPMGQLEHTDYQRFATLPRTNEPKPPKVETDPRWFGGRGSVRDLAQLYQHQIQEHQAYQSVVNGTVNKNHSNEMNLNDTPHSYLYSNVNELKGTRTFHALIKAAQEKVHQLTYDVDDDSSSMVTASSVNDQIDSKQSEESSTESDQISKWVDHELRKIKRNLSKELAVKESLKNIAASPDLFERSGKQTQIPEKLDSLTCSESNTSSESQQASGDKDRFAHVDSCYFDDEMYTDEAPVKTDPSFTDDEVDVPASPARNSLPMNTVLKETPTKDVKGKGSVNKGSSGNNKKRLSRIPTSKSNLSSRIKNSDAAYANIVTVKSSLDDAGVHQVTHKMKNLKTGGTKTVFNDKVNAKKVVTTFRAAR